MDGHLGLLRRASKEMISAAATNLGAAIVTRTRRLSDAMKSPQLTRKLSGSSQKPPELLHRRPSFQGGQPVPRDIIQHHVREEDFAANQIGARAKSGDFTDFLDGVAQAEASQREKNRRKYGPRQRTLSVDTAGDYVVRNQGILTTSYERNKAVVPGREYGYNSLTLAHEPSAKRETVRSPPKQPVPDSVVPGQKLRDSVNFPDLDPPAAVYGRQSQRSMGTATEIEYEIDTVDRRTKQFRFEKKLASGQDPTRDSGAFVSPSGKSTIQRKGAIRRSLSSGNLALDWQTGTTPAPSTAYAVTPVDYRRTTSTNPQVYPAEPIGDWGRYPQMKGGHSREPSKASGNSGTTSYQPAQQQPTRPVHRHAATVPLLPHRSPINMPPPQPVAWPTREGRPSQKDSSSWYTARKDDGAAHMSSSASRSTLRSEGPPLSSSSGSSGYAKPSDKNVHRHRKRDLETRPPLSKSSDLGRELLGGGITPVRYERERERERAIYQLPHSTSTPHLPGRSSPQRSSSQHTPHRPSPLITAFGQPSRHNRTTSRSSYATTSSPSSLYPPTPPPLPNATVYNAIPPANPTPPPLSDFKAMKSRREYRQPEERVRSTYAAEVGLVEREGSRRLGDDHIRQRRESESKGHRRRGTEEGASGGRRYL